MLDGRVALITGSTRGIGWAMAELFAAHGANVIVHGREADGAVQARAAELTARHGREVMALGGDLSDPAAVRALFPPIFKRHRRLDILVNNAGVLIDGLLGMIPDADITRSLHVNAMAPIVATQEAARLMARHKTGSIINVTSIIGRVGTTGMSVYAASKAAVIGLTHASAKELAPQNIRVNAIAPGFIDTDMATALAPEKHAERLASVRMGRIGTPADVANAALFLASDLSSYVTGQVLGVDGGMIV